MCPSGRGCRRLHGVWRRAVYSSEEPFERTPQVMRWSVTQPRPPQNPLVFLLPKVEAVPPATHGKSLENKGRARWASASEAPCRFHKGEFVGRCGVRLWSPLRPDARDSALREALSGRAGMFRLFAFGRRYWPSRSEVSVRAEMALRLLCPSRPSISRELVRSPLRNNRLNLTARWPSPFRNPPPALCVPFGSRMPAASRNLATKSVPFVEPLERTPQVMR